MCDLCCKCFCKSELLDVLTNRRFCGWCYRKALEDDLVFTSFQHVKDRFYHRYKIILTINKYRDIIEQIEDPVIATNLGEIVRTKSVDTSSHLVSIDGKRVLVIYIALKNSCVHGCLITALPIQKILRGAKQLVNNS